MTTFILFLLVAWWSYYSKEILLSHYGYDFNAMNNADSLKNVAIENQNKVDVLQKSRLGIGWPLKAFIIFPFFIPYIVAVYVGMYFYKKLKFKKYQNQEIV